MSHFLSILVFVRSHKVFGYGLDFRIAIITHHSCAFGVRLY